MDSKKKIEAFIIEEVCPDLGVTEIKEDENLIDSGMMDSLGILKILDFLDEEFGVDLSSDEIKHENFETIKKIMEMVNANE